MNEDFQITQEAYSGPLELLLDLIEKRKLCVNDISLAAIAESYVAYVEKHKEFSIERAASFVSVAATLILIKSVSLLPSLEVTQEEQASMEDLELRLKEYQRIRELAVHITARFGKTVLFQRSRKFPKEAVFVPTEEITIASLASALSEFLAHFPVLARLPKAAVRKLLSLEAVMESLLCRVTDKLRTSFREFVGKGEKHQVIVSFLAVLELAKRGSVLVHQESSSEDIMIETLVPGVPRYA